MEINLSALFGSPTFWIIVVGLLIAIVVSCYLAVHLGLRSFLAQVEEDLVNTYTPKILEKKPLPNYESKEPEPTETAEE